MKRMMIRTALVVVATTTTALSLEIDPDNPVQVAYIEKRMAELEEARQKALKGDDMALREVIRGFRDLDIRAYTPGVYLDDMKNLVGSGIPRERVIRVLESMIRENIPVMEKSERESMGYLFARADVDYSLMMIEAFSDHNILPLVKDCLKSKISTVHGVALQTYVNIEGAKAIPALREIFAQENLTDNTRIWLYRHFERVATSLADKQQTDDAEQMKAFVKEMKQTDEKRQAKGKGEN